MGRGYRSKAPNEVPLQQGGNIFHLSLNSCPFCYIPGRHWHLADTFREAKNLYVGQSKWCRSEAPGFMEDACPSSLLFLAGQCLLASEEGQQGAV